MNDTPRFGTAGLADSYTVKKFDPAAIAAAQNLLVSFAEKAVDEGRIDTILVPRVSEVPSRSLRQITVDSGKNNVAERVVLTPTCEMMQIVVVSRSMEEIGERVAAMIAGTKDGKPVAFGEFIDLWRITNMLADAVKPALTETLNGSPVYVHGGPFANVSLGIPTLVAVEMACALHDVVIVEAGYGDLTLSGHVHSMQLKIRPWGRGWSPAKWIYKHWSGRYDTGRHTLYVNDGTGYVAYPMRLGAWPEVTLFTLKRCR